MKNIPSILFSLFAAGVAFAGSKDKTLDVYWIDSEGGENSCKEVFLVEWLFRHVHAVLIGGADDDTAFDSAAGQHEAPGIRVMVATSGLVA